MASPSTTSLPAPRRLIDEPCPAQSSAVWKTRRVLTGSSTVAAPTPGPDDHQRHVHRRLIEQVAVLRFAVVAEPLAMIAGHNHRRLRPPRLEGLRQAPELLVDGGHLAQVRCGVAGPEPRRRFVGRVGIEVVDPEEQRPGRILLREVGERTFRRRSRVALVGRARQLVVVVLEAARQAKPARQHERRDERGGPIAGASERFGEQRLVGAQEARVLVHAVARGIESRQHRDVRRQGFRDGRVRLPEIAVRARRAR